MRVVIIGGGWAGTAAAISARKAGTEVCLLEKTDMLLGVGNAGGIMRNNGRFTAAEEMIALGGGELFQLIDRIALHRNVEFPGHHHATLYPVNTIEAHVRRLVKGLGIEVHCSTHICDVECAGDHLTAVVSDAGERFAGDVFIETTGSAGPMGNCLKYGNGCSMCVLRCPAYGPRISISGRCGQQDYRGERVPDVFGVFSGSCKLSKESLSEELQQELNTKGVAIIPLPKEEVNYDKLKMKACKQYAIKDFSENMIILDTGDAKLMTSYYPLDKLRLLPGLENARYIDPYAGSKGNSIRYLSLAYRSNAMTVDGMANLLCAGEKSGLFIGHTEAIVTGTLAGANAARLGAGKPLLTLPETLAVGDIIAAANTSIKERHDTLERFTFSGGNYFKRMQEKNLYTTDLTAIAQRVERAGLTGVYNAKVL
jgi:hypothetical protein